MIGVIQELHWGVSEGPGTLCDVKGTAPANLSSACNILGEASSHLLVFREYLKTSITNILGNWSQTTFPEEDECMHTLSHLATEQFLWVPSSVLSPEKLCGSGSSCIHQGQAGNRWNSQEGLSEIKLLRGLSAEALTG